MHILSYDTTKPTVPNPAWKQLFKTTELLIALSKNWNQKQSELETNCCSLGIFCLIMTLHVRNAIIV